MALTPQGLHSASKLLVMNEHRWAAILRGFCGAVIMLAQTLDQIRGGAKRVAAFRLTCER